MCIFGLKYMWIENTIKSGRNPIRLDSVFELFFSSVYFKTKTHKITTEHNIILRSIATKINPKFHSNNSHYNRR